MTFVKRDGIIIVVVIAVLGFLFTGKGKMKAVNAPHNEKHRSFYEAVSKGGNRIEVEKGCTTCHGITAVPLSKGHPHKEQCLICHPLSKDQSR